MFTTSWGAAVAGFVVTAMVTSKAAENRKRVT